MPTSNAPNLDNCLEAAHWMGIDDSTVYSLLGVDNPPSAAVVPSGRSEHAQLIVELHYWLDKNLGGNREQAHHFLNTRNTILGGVPRELIREPEGLASVVAFLSRSMSR